MQHTPRNIPQHRPVLSELSNRSREIFRLIMDTYFETGEPVGSRTLSRKLGQLSPATIRNVMADLEELGLLFAEHARLLRRGGRYVTITGCYNDAYGLPSRAVSEINAHYICDIHPRSTYFREMAANRLVPVSVVDLTSATIPYWELRAKSTLATGIEQAFLDAYKGGSFQYLLIAADRV